MRVLRGFASVLIGIVIFIAGAYFALSLCIAYFKLTGRIVEGLPMYRDLYTPSWLGLLVFQAFCVAILAVAFFLQSKLQGLSAQARSG